MDELPLDQDWRGTTKLMLEVRHSQTFQLIVPAQLQKSRAQFHRAAKQLIFCLLYVFHFIALLRVAVTHREKAP